MRQKLRYMFSLLLLLFTFSAISFPLPVHATEVDSDMTSSALTLSYTLEENHLTISWETVQDASIYHFTLTDDAGYTQYVSADSADTSVTIRLTYGHSYFLHAMALDASENILSEFTVENICLPGKVKNLTTCSQSRSKVVLSWDAADYADHYVIYRKNGNGTYDFLTETTNCSFTDTDLEYSTTYYYRVTAVKTSDLYTVETPPSGKTFKNRSIVSTNHQRYSFEEMAVDIKELVNKYHGLVNYEIIGTTPDDRDIYCVVLGNPDAEKSTLVVSTLHAREYMCSLLSMKQIEYYLENYNNKIGGQKVSELLNEMAIYYVPMANPDGVTLSQYGINGIDNEYLITQLNKIIDGKTSTWKSNARGVDLNWNFDYKFKRRGTPGSQSYSGKSANSEPESKAVTALLARLKKHHNLQGVINYHAMGSIIFGGAPGNGKLNKTTKQMYDLAIQITGYKSAAGYTGSGGYGNLREYIIYNLRIPSITLELGTVSCPLPISQFPSIWKKNKDLVIREAMLLNK